MCAVFSVFQFLFFFADEHIIAMFVWHISHRSAVHFSQNKSATSKPANCTFLSEQISHQQPANSTFLLEQISISHWSLAK
jgi:hypothetical protein